MHTWHSIFYIKLYIITSTSCRNNINVVSDEIIKIRIEQKHTHKYTKQKKKKEGISYISNNNNTNIISHIIERNRCLQ